MDQYHHPHHHYNKLRTQHILCPYIGHVIILKFPALCWTSSSLSSSLLSTLTILSSSKSPSQTYHTGVLAECFMPYPPMSVVQPLDLLLVIIIFVIITITTVIIIIIAHHHHHHHNQVKWRTLIYSQHAFGCCIRHVHPEAN